MVYAPQTWADNDISKPLSAARMAILEAGVKAAHDLPVAAAAAANYRTFNVDTYGAVSDGMTDDTAAFTNASQALIAAGSGIFDMSAKTYRTGFMPTFQPPTASGSLPFGVRGRGMGVTRILHYGTTPGSSLTVNNPAFTGSAGSTIAPRWSGFTIDGSNSSGGACGIRWGDVSYGSLHDINVANFASGDGLFFTNQYGWTEGMNLAQVMSQYNGTQVHWDVGSGREVGTITTALTSGTAYTTIAVAGGLTSALYAGQNIVIAVSSSAIGVTTQTCVVTTAANVGDTSIAVTSFTAVTNYAAGTAKVHYGGFGSYDYWTIDGLYIQAGVNQNGWVSEISRGINQRIDRLGCRYKVTGNFRGGSGNTGIILWAKGIDTYNDTGWHFTVETGGSAPAHKSIQLDNTAASIGGHGVLSCYGAGAYTNQLYQIGFNGVMCISGISTAASQANPTTTFRTVRSPGRTNIGTGVRPSSSTYPNSGAAIVSGTAFQNTTGRDLLVTVPITFNSTGGTASVNVDTYSGLSAAPTQESGTSQTSSVRFLHHADAWARVDVTNATIGTPLTTWA